MLNRVRVIKEHFNIGMTNYPVGAEISVNDMVRDYLVKEGAVEIIENGYLRRDMQAESKPKRRRRKKVAS